MLSGSVMFYYVLDAQLFLKPRFVHYREYILLMIKSFFPPLLHVKTTAFLIQLLTKSVRVNRIHTHTHIKRIMWGIFKIIFGIYEF